jgi:hypothetical protein
MTTISQAEEADLPAIDELAKLLYGPDLAAAQPVRQTRGPSWRERRRA